MNKQVKVIVVAVALVVLGLFCTRLYHVAQNPLEYGIIMVEGYEHAVALCGEAEEDTPVTTQKDKYHMWAKDNVLYTVNYGHMEDEEIKILRALATVHCQ